MLTKPTTEEKHLEEVQSPPSVRYGITCIASDGYRKLATPAQARHLWNTSEEAEDWLRAMLEDLSNKSRLNQVHGQQSEGTFQVSRFRCWPSGDPIGCYPLDEPMPTTDP